LLEPIAAALEDDGYVVPTDRKNLLALIDRLFAESYGGSAEAPSLVRTPPWVPLVFSRYCDSLSESNRLDFGSLLHFARRLLAEKPGVARVMRLGWTHVCVDEFQDTSKAQYDLLRLMVAGTTPNLFVVADDDQIIYQWNGASPERLQTLQSDYAMEVVQLPENYRCPPEIVTIANKLIIHNIQRNAGKKPLAAYKPASLENGVIRYGVFDTVELEVAGVAVEIHERRIAGPECVILARTTKLLEQAAAALRTAGLAAYLAQRKNEFETPIVRVVLNALRLTNARHDRDVLRRLCVAWEDLTSETLEVEDVAATASLLGGDFLRAWADAACKKQVEAPARAILARIRSSLVDRLDFPGITEWFLSEGWKHWDDSSLREVADEIATWGEIHSDLVREHSVENLTLNIYLQQMDLASKAPVPARDAIRCMTVHGSKGLEFKHVFLIGMAQEVLPSFQALKKGAQSRELEEERRNCFVAITRAQETLTLTRARAYNGWNKEPSQFLSEMGIVEEQ
jgi:DNA helicase-2/ATP-dependent DNA helicase PcrA